MNDDDVIRGFSTPKFSLRTLLLIVAIVAMCVAFVVASENRYHAICWLVPPLFILTRNHGRLDYASLAIRFALAVVVWSILFFPAVLQDTRTWEANNQDWIAAHPSEYDAINETLSLSLDLSRVPSTLVLSSWSAVQSPMPYQT